MLKNWQKSIKKASTKSRPLDAVWLLLFVSCSHATCANVFCGCSSVDFHCYFFEISAVGFRSLSVGVRNLVTWHFAFSAYSTYLWHIDTSVLDDNFCLIFTLVYNNIVCNFWQAKCSKKSKNKGLFQNIFIFGHI